MPASSVPLVTSVSALTIALHGFVSALLRQNPHSPHSSPLRVIIGFQSTRPLTPRSSNLTVHKQIFVAAEKAASEAAACSRVWKFYQTRTVHLNCRIVLNDMKLGHGSACFLLPYTVKSGVIFTAEVVSASVFARCGCHGKDSEMFGSGGCFCGLRVK